MIRKHAWYGLALVASAALAAACSSDGSSNGSNSGVTGGAPGTGGATGVGGSATGGDTGVGGTGTGGDIGSGGAGTGGTSTTPLPSRAADYDCTPATGAVPALKLTTVVSNLTRPVFLTHVPGDSTRLFVLEQEGLLKIIQGGAVLPTEFLDLTGLIDRGGPGDFEWDERGLLGLAFHPDYATNGLLYVYHTQGTSPMQNVIAEYKVSASDPNVVDTTTRREVLVITDPANNHNGGTIEFGGDGFLYFASGDGGGSNNTYNTAQNPESLLGKVLRIDVNTKAAGKEYGIPAGNLTTIGGQAAAPEIWDYGLRNPYRWSFDGCTGDMYIGDVGQDETEEINIEPAGTGHRNYGWSITEGNDCFQAATCDTTGITFPVTTRPRNTAGAIQGGYVYRGAAIPGLRGTYIYGEYTTGDIYTLRWDGTTAQNVQKSSLALPAALLSFGQDNDGEIYALGNEMGTGTGVVYRIDPQ